MNATQTLNDAIAKQIDPFYFLFSRVASMDFRRRPRFRNIS
ncbi:MAG TPA: hypothetical protein VMV49_07710 [Candidatus Deferrimicrobium sp.]|nr:hypothetical protein [Candidatus Deferrimicrobium sp.]